MIKVIKCKITTIEKVYMPGDTITTLSPADEESLINDGYAERVEGTGVKSSGKEKEIIPTAEELIKQIEASESIEELQKILADEQENKKRKTVLAAAAAKIEALSAKNEDDDDKGTNPENPAGLVGNFNASDVIVPGGQK
jgi:hypothetical protein